jgi:hypothetical protein
VLGLAAGQVFGAGPLDAAQVGVHHDDAVSDASIRGQPSELAQHRLRILTAARVHKDDVEIRQFRFGVRVALDRFHVQGPFGVALFVLSLRRVR